MNKPLIVILVASLTAVALRIVPMPLDYNFSALGALALLCGALLKRPLPAIAIVLGCRLITDFWIQSKTGYGFYQSMAFDYAAYALVCGLGMVIAPRNPLAVMAGGVGAGLTFFLVSNFGVWFLSADHDYARSVAGLLSCYVKGLPFARGTFFGDILFSGVFFGIHALVTKPVTVEAPATTH